MYFLRNYRIYVIFFLLLFFSVLGYFFLVNKEGLDQNLVDMIPVSVSKDNNTITVPNNIKGNNNQNLTFKGGMNVNNNAIHKGNTFIKPTGPWANAQPSIDLAIGDNDTGMKWKSDGIVSFMGNAQEIGTFGHDGLTMNGRRTMEFGKGEEKEVNAGKIGYKTWTGNSLDIVGAGKNGEARKVHIWDDLNVGNSMTIRNLLEFGANTGKSWNGNGSISYKTPWDNTALNIVGAEHPGQPRKVHLWDDVEIGSNLRVNGSVTIGSPNQFWTIHSQHGLLYFTYNGHDRNNWNNDVGNIIMTHDGNLWLSRSSFRGWVSDNMRWVHDRLSSRGI
jgi:hypothetical protein